MDSLLNAIVVAIQKAERTARKGLADPYGCFVTPVEHMPEVALKLSIMLLKIPLK
jgi:hypothetical protein